MCKICKKLTNFIKQNHRKVKVGIEDIKIQKNKEGKIVQLVDSYNRAYFLERITFLGTSSKTFSKKRNIVNEGDSYTSSQKFEGYQSYENRSKNRILQLGK